MNATSAARLELLYPRLKTAGQQLLQLLALKGIDCEIAQGLRSWAEQEMLYEKGRSTPGPIVTNATPSLTWHVYGCALDIDIVTATGLDWTGNDAAWSLAISTGESLGLVAGAGWRTFPDRPHFQLTGRFPVTPDAEVLALYESGGVEAVWAEIEKSYADAAPSSAVDEADAM